MIKRGIAFFLFVLVAFLAISWVVMTLWNFAVAPTFDNVETIDYLQAMALLALSKIFLLGMRGGRPGPAPWKRRWKHRWDHMSDQDKEKLKEEWKGRWKKS